MTDNTASLSTSLDTAGQYPLDRKLYFITIDEMKDLGTNNTKALKYYEDMNVQCVESHSNYTWRERTQEDASSSGVLDNDYTYPNGAISIGVDYSGRSFNFFLASSNSSAGSIKFQDNICWSITPPQQTISFSKLDNADISLPENRDIIIQGVLEITRDINRGIFNIATETSYDNLNFTSPENTEWAFGDFSSDLSSIPFLSWNDCFWQNNPTAQSVEDIVGQTYIVRIISTNQYFELTFTSWNGGNGLGSGSGGGFSYTRTALISQQDTEMFSGQKGYLIRELDSNNNEIVLNRVFIQNNIVISEPLNWSLCDSENSSQNNIIQEVTVSFSGATPPTDSEILNAINNYPVPINVEEDVNLVFNVDYTQIIQS